MDRRFRPRGPYNSWLIEPYAHPAESVSDFVVGTFKVFDGHIEVSQHRHLPVAYGVQVRCGENVGERVVVCPDNEWAVL